METLNQNTPYNTTQNKILNSISLEHNQPLVENVLGRHPILLSDKREAMSDPSGLSTTQLLHKPIVFANNISWSVDQEINATVHTASLLSIFETLNRSPGGQNLRGNAFFRSGAKIELKLTSSPFHSGKLVFYYVPPGVRTQFRESIYSKVQFPCVYVDAANSTTGMLNIPFVTLKDFFSTYVPDDFSDFGDIVVAVLNPLRIGTGGPTSVQLALTLHPTQNDICLPILAHDINIEIQGGFEEYLEDLGGNLAQMFMGGSPDEVLRNKVDVNTPQIQNILHNIHQTVTSGDATKMPGLPPQSVVAPPMSNLDKPTQGNPPPNPNNTTTQTKVNNSAPTLSNPTGITTEHLSLVPEKTVIIETPNQEMNLLNVAKIPSLIRIGEWMDSQNSGAILFKTPIEPMVCPFLPSANTTTGVYYPTYLSHVTAPFAFWNGSIDYHISFAGTEQHKGKVIAAWLPFDRLTEDARTSLFLGRDPTIEELSLYPNEIFDLSLNKEFSFSVPYNSETPFRYVPDVNYQISTVDGTPSGEALSDYSLGIFYLAIYNKLSHPTTVSSTINYNVYIKAGPDYSLHGLQFSQDVGNQYQKINYITLQGLDLVYESTRNGMANEQSNRIGISQNTIKSASFQSDNSEHNLGVLLQKYYPQFAYRVEIEALDTTQVTIPSLPGLNFRAPRNVDPTLFPDPRWRNLIAHFRDIYAFWQGSLNYFIIHNTTVNNPLLLSVSHDPTRFNVPNARVTVGQQAQTTNAYYVPVRTSTPLTTNDADLSETSIYSHISNLRVNPTIEITTPHRSLYRRLYTADSKILAEEATEQTDSIGNLDLTYSNPSADNITASAIIYQSIGDDFQFKYIIPPPSLKSRR